MRSSCVASDPGTACRGALAVVKPKVLLYALAAVENVEDDRAPAVCPSWAAGSASGAGPGWVLWRGGAASSATSVLGLAACTGVESATCMLRAVWPSAEYQQPQRTAMRRWRSGRSTPPHLACKS